MEEDEPSTFRCDEGKAPSTRLVTAGQAPAGIKVDIHCHMSVPEAAAVAKPHFDPALDANSRFMSAEAARINQTQAADLKPRLSTVAAKLADMDRMGIDMQVLSPAPPQYYYWADAELGRQTSRIINDRIAESVAAHPDRFAGLATLPMQAPELAVAEMRRAVNDLGLKGIEISTNVAGAELSEPQFAPVLQAAEELGILVFMHPLGFSHGERMQQHYLNNVIGNPLESTVALSHLIFGGVLDRYPGLRICVAHGGGYLPGYSGRMDHAWRVRPDCRGCQHPPSSYLKRLWFDTVVFDPEQLAYLVERFGAERIVMGTDYPFDMGETDPIGLVSSVPGLSEEDCGRIMGGNACELLGLHPVRSGEQQRET
jgi:aminocarboxymuconate-semialdehyde decarboxylase